MKIRGEGINDAWLRVIKALSENGKEYAPRGRRIKELLNVSVEIENPKKRILSTPIRKISLPFAFGELLWYLSANNKVEPMEYYSKMMKSFSDDGETLNSAYGYRIFGKHKDLPFDQWQFVVDKLKEDPDSRQAIIHLHTPNNKPTKDEVCTLTLQFFIRNGKLDMVVNMRSNDIIWGFTYDVFSFTTFQELMANELGVDVGKYFHNAGSMHIYEKDYFYFDFLKVYDSLIYMTKFDQEFSYDSLTRHSEDLDDLILNEEAYREYREYADVNTYSIDNHALQVIDEVLYQYRILKMQGKNELRKHLRYDNIYHGMMRNYISGKKLDESKLLITDGCDGAGKSTFIRRASFQSILDVIAFEKPYNDFNKQIYFNTALLSGDVVLDRFYLSEWVYSKIFGRASRVNWDDVTHLEKLLNFRNANYLFFDTDPKICYERLDNEDKQTFSFEQIERICDSYELMFRVCNIKDKNKFSKC